MSIFNDLSEILRIKNNFPEMLQGHLQAFNYVRWLNHLIMSQFSQIQSKCNLFVFQVGK